MCEFCVKHGEGKKWYLQAGNYSEDLLSDLKRRNFILDFLGHPEHLEGMEAAMASLPKLPPFVRRAISADATRKQKKIHFGQVVPLEDVKEILSFVNSVVRLPCICRHVTLGREARYCYGVSMGPGGGKIGELMRGIDNSFLSGPDTHGLEELSRDAAIEAMAGHEREGLCHTVWTFITPFIGGICNCDRVDCRAMQATVTHGMKVMFRAEYVAAVDRDLCTGCRACMRLCQFGAIAYSAADAQASIDPTACYGCGICRSMCAKNAIALKPRAEEPMAARFA